MPEWLHSRALHILAKNPEMGKSQAFAIATQQSHATGHTPKSYGTSAGKHEAKAKYDEPKKEYEQAADPSGVGGKLERAEDKGKLQIKQASRKALASALQRIQADDVARVYQSMRGRKKEKQAGLGSVLSFGSNLENTRRITELQKQIEELKKTRPPVRTKQASSMLTSPFDAIVLGGFSDELRKIAAEMSAPTGLTEIKSTIPTKPLSGKTPKYTKVNTEPSPSPMSNVQPLSQPPAVRT